MANSLNLTGVEDLPKQVEMLREFGMWPVLLIFAHVNKFCPVIVEMCGLRTDYHSGMKIYKLHCLKVKQATDLYDCRKKWARCQSNTLFYCKEIFFRSCFDFGTGPIPNSRNTPLVLENLQPLSCLVIPRLVNTFWIILCAPKITVIKNLLFFHLVVRLFIYLF